jgi:RING finger protein 170
VFSLFSFVVTHQKQKTSVMEHRPEPQLTFAQARYANASHPVAPTFPAGCDLFSSLSNGDSVARSFLRVAVPSLSMVLLILWLARLTVHWLQRWQVAHLAKSWETLPYYAEALEVAEALQQSREHASTHPHTTDAQSCTICFSSSIEHPVALLPCGHQQYCAHCIVQLWEYSGVYRQLKCPLCRQPVELMCPVQVAGSMPSLDDVLLLQRYNNGFCGAKKHSLLDQWVLRLRAITSARLLPFVIGLRIVVLHATIFTYIILPAFVSDSVAAMTARFVEQTAASDSAAEVAVSGVVRGVAAVLQCVVTYADDLFVVAMSIILTGSLIQSTLFKDLKL